MHQPYNYRYETVTLGTIDSASHSVIHRTLFYGTSHDKTQFAQTLFDAMFKSIDPATGDLPGNANLTSDTFYAALNQVDLSQENNRIVLFAAIKSHPRIRQLILSDVLTVAPLLPPQSIELRGISFDELGLSKAKRKELLGDEYDNYGWTAQGRLDWEQADRNARIMTQALLKVAPEAITPQLKENAEAARIKIKSVLADLDVDFAYRLFKGLPNDGNMDFAALANRAQNYPGIAAGVFANVQLQNDVATEFSADHITTLLNNTINLPLAQRSKYFSVILNQLLTLIPDANANIDLAMLLANSSDPITNLSLLLSSQEASLRDRLVASAPEIFMTLMRRDHYKAISLMRPLIIEFINSCNDPRTPEQNKQVDILFNATEGFAEMLNLEEMTLRRVHNNDAFVAYNCPEYGNNPRKYYNKSSAFNVFGVYNNFFNQKYAELFQQHRDLFPVAALPPVPVAAVPPAAVPPAVAATDSHVASHSAPAPAATVGGTAASATKKGKGKKEPRTTDPLLGKPLTSSSPVAVTPSPVAAPVTAPAAATPVKKVAEPRAATPPPAAAPVAAPTAATPAKKVEEPKAVTPPPTVAPVAAPAAATPVKKVATTAAAVSPAPATPVTKLPPARDAELDALMTHLGDTKITVAATPKAVVDPKIAAEAKKFVSDSLTVISATKDVEENNTVLVEADRTKLSDALPVHPEFGVLTVTETGDPEDEGVVEALHSLDGVIEGLGHKPSAAPAASPAKTVPEAATPPRAAPPVVAATPGEKAAEPKVATPPPAAAPVAAPATESPVTKSAQPAAATPAPATTPIGDPNALSAQTQPTGKKKKRNRGARPAKIADASTTAVRSPVVASPPQTVSASVAVPAAVIPEKKAAEPTAATPHSVTASVASPAPATPVKTVAETAMAVPAAPPPTPTLRASQTASVNSGSEWEALFAEVEAMAPPKGTEEKPLPAEALFGPVTVAGSATSTAPAAALPELLNDEGIVDIFASSAGVPTGEAGEDPWNVAGVVFDDEKEADPDHHADNSEGKKLSAASDAHKASLQAILEKQLAERERSTDGSRAASAVKIAQATAAATPPRALPKPDPESFTTPPVATAVPEVGSRTPPPPPQARKPLLALTEGTGTNVPAVGTDTPERPAVGKTPPILGDDTPEALPTVNAGASRFALLPGMTTVRSLGSMIQDTILPKSTNPTTLGHK